MLAKMSKKVIRLDIIVGDVQIFMQEFQSFSNLDGQFHSSEEDVADLVELIDLILIHAIWFIERGIINFLKNTRVF